MEPDSAMRGTGGGLLARDFIRGRKEIACGGLDTTTRIFAIMKNSPYAYLFCAVALLGLPLVSVCAPAAAADEIPPDILKKYDANKDGALDESERAAWFADREKQQAARETRQAADLARYDANKNGKLDPDERAARRADNEKARAERQAAREARRAEKTAAAEAKKLARYDRNKNGKLDEDELAAAKVDEEKRKAAAEKRKVAREAAKQAPASAKQAPASAKQAPASEKQDQEPVDDDAPQTERE